MPPEFLRWRLGFLAAGLACLLGCGSQTSAIGGRSGSTGGSGAPTPGPGTPSLAPEPSPVLGPTLVPGRPYLVKDIVPGFGDSYPRSLVDVDGTLFFIADDGLHGWELWRSDGTDDGTFMVKDINPSASQRCAGRCPAPPAPLGLARVGRQLFFDGNDGMTGEEPWTSDGTENGTVLLKDVNPGSGSSLYDGLDFIDLDGVAIFAASDPISGQELWRSDGTPAGTRLVKDINPGTASSAVPFGQRTIGLRTFLLADDGVHGNEPWVTDGTSSGTYMLRDINKVPFLSTRPGSGATEFTALRYVYFMAYDGSSRDLWRTDGTEAGTTIVKRLPPGPKALFTESGGRLFFWAEDPATGRELWASDGTEAGTGVIGDARPGPAGSNPSEVTAFAGFVIFAAADDPHGIELWRSDGTAAGTFMVKDIRPGAGSANPRNFVIAANRVYFTASDDNSCSLWMTDGTEDGTQAVTGSDGLCPVSLTPSGDRVFFSSGTRDVGSELWAIELSPPR